MNKYLVTIISTIFATSLLLLIPNKSNFPKQIIVPILVAIFVKYSLGDWDKKYVWTKSDIVFWITIFVTSLLAIIANDNIFTS